VQDKPETLTPIALTDKSGEQVSVPWPTLLTGMVFIQVFYWSTNQVIVQRAMGAKSLADGQKGVLFAAGMKILGPIMLCLPGIIALHMTDTLDIAKNDEVYPTIVRHVLPHWALGLFCAVIVGAILSSFNSALNSAATLFCIDFYEPFKNRRNPNGTSVKHVGVGGQIFATLLAIMAMVVAPMLEQMQSIFDYLQKINGLYSVPIIVIFLVGVLNRKASAMGAKAAMVAGILSYAGFTFADTAFPALQWPAWYHWLHGYGISVAIAFATLVVVTLIVPRSQQSIEHDAETQVSPVDMTPWSLAPAIACVIAACAAGLYVGLFVLSH
jgi:SSS family solute:Na+ symporter